MKIPCFFRFFPFHFRVCLLQRGRKTIIMGAKTVMKMKFTKMQAYGNDYVYADAFSCSLPSPQETAKRICDRHYGVGGDGLVLLCPSERAHFRMRIFDPDGTEAEMCGNALRSAAFLFRKTHGGVPDALSVETLSGIRRVLFSGEDGKEIRTDLGAPVVFFSGKRISAGGKEFEATGVSFGNPHCVLFPESLTDEEFFRLGPLVEKHPLFPQRTNVEFVSVLGKDRLKIRTWERGCGETLSCATGSAAAVVAAFLAGKCMPNAAVEQTSGTLSVRWDRRSGHLWVTGDTRIVFTGEYEENCPEERNVNL